MNRTVSRVCVGIVCILAVIALGLFQQGMTLLESSRGVGRLADAIPLAEPTLAAVTAGDLALAVALLRDQDSAALNRMRENGLLLDLPAGTRVRQVTCDAKRCAVETGKSRRVLWVAVDVFQVNKVRLKRGQAPH